MARPKISISGATGFVGGALVTELMSASCFDVCALTRRAPVHVVAGVQYMQLGELSAETDWRPGLSGVDVVVHAAARVHVMQDTLADPLTEFRRINVQGTLNLARQAASAGVERFVFVSSVKVNGESTQPGAPFAADDVAAPLDAYGISKMEAEQGLRDLAVKTGLEVVIIRPPLVYGSGVKANFSAMMRWLQRGVPLPLGAIHNQRSLVALDNLVDLIVTCLTHPAAANQTFLVSDGEDVSTTELLRRMGQAMGHPARLVPVPAGLLKLVATMLGKRDVTQRLCGSLQVDIEKTRRLLDWTPPLSLDEGLKKAAEGYGREAGI
jgi:nucleoside-diphosphate-sugar epimerase